MGFEWRCQGFLFTSLACGVLCWIPEAEVELTFCWLGLHSLPLPVGPFCSKAPMLLSQGIYWFSGRICGDELGQRGICEPLPPISQPLLGEALPTGFWCWRCLYPVQHPLGVQCKQVSSSPAAFLGHLIHRKLT